MVLRRWIFGSGAAGMVRSLRGYSSICESAAKSPPPPPPWVMLPPPAATDGAELVGWSQGWLALFNKRNDDLFLSDPLSNRRIKLPPVKTLPDPNLNLDAEGHGRVSKVILSSSPYDDDCRAMMIFGLAKRLAFCLPGRSTKWTPIGSLFIDCDYFPFVTFARVHDDLVYCSKRRVFTSVAPFAFYWERPEKLFGISMSVCDRRFLSQSVFHDFLSMFYDWELQYTKYHNYCPGLPLKGRQQQQQRGSDNKFWPFSELREGGAMEAWLGDNHEVLSKQCVQIPHLVYAEHSNQLFIAVRFVSLVDGGGIPYCPVKGLQEVLECKTIGFIVMEVDSLGYLRVVEDLNGMAMFVGINNSIAIPIPIPIPGVNNHPFQRDSIYFTDAKRSKMMCGVNDNGVFDYKNKTISPAAAAAGHDGMCYDMESILSI